MKINTKGLVILGVAVLIPTILGNGILGVWHAYFVGGAIALGLVAVCLEKTTP